MADRGSGLFRKQALERLSSPEQLDQLMQVVAPRSWLLLAGLGLLLTTLLLWGVFGKITTTVQGRGVLSEPGVALLYLPADEAASLKPGMPVRLSFANASPQEYGYLVGTVGSVGAVPLDLATLTEKVANANLAQTLSAAGDPVEVTIRLDASDTPSGYAWTSAQGPDFELASGTPTVAEITVDEKRPLSIVLPVDL